MAVWDESRQDVPLGKCVTRVPSDSSHNQKMNTEWFDLISPTGNPAGKIRLGIQYIYDQVKLIDTIMEKRQEEREVHLKDLEASYNALKQTSAPFELLIGPAKNSTAQNLNNEPTVFDEAFDKVATTFYKGIIPIEDYVVGNAKTLQTTQWGRFAQIGSLIYALLSLIIAFANEDFINVLLSLIGVAYIFCINWDSPLLP